MRELGESSPEEHERVGRLAARLGVDRVLAVGEAARPVHAGACAEGRPGAEEPAHVADNDAAVAWLRAVVRRGDVVLVKASRGARLDEVAEALLGAGAAS
jgi:UDP-N-acetylmuramoyl-tripeptide--D-alanyl-D-alanine ligase